MCDASNDFIEEQFEKIVAIEVEIDSIVGKFKVSQNRSAVDAENVAKALENSNPKMAESVRKYFPHSVLLKIRLLTTIKKCPNNWAFFYFKSNL